MKYRAIQAGLMLACALLINAIAWPGPHGGPQFLGTILWRQVGNAQLALLALLAIGLAGSFLSIRIARVGCAFVSCLGLAGLYAILLSRIYPPARLMVVVFSIPAIASLAG